MDDASGGQMSEKDKMLTGMLYNATTETDHIAEREDCTELTWQFNSLNPKKMDEKRALLKKLFGSSMCKTPRYATALAVTIVTLVLVVAVLHVALSPSALVGIAPTYGPSERDQDRMGREHRRHEADGPEKHRNESISRAGWGRRGKAGIIDSVQLINKQFKDPPKKKLPDTQRLWPVTQVGTPKKPETAVKPCDEPYDGMPNVGRNVLNSCMLQGMVRLLRNWGCFHKEIEECAEGTTVPGCATPEVHRVHELMTNMGNDSLDDYMVAHGLKPGQFQNELQVLSDSLFGLSRKDVSGVSTITALGAKFSLRMRHYIKNDQRNMFTHVPYQMVLDEGSKPETDFSEGNKLMEFVFGIHRENLFVPSARFGSQLLVHLNRPPGAGANYYDGRSLALYADGLGSGVEAQKIPLVVTRMLFRFDFVALGARLRKVPATFVNNGRKFHLAVVIAQSRQLNHFFNLVLKWHKGGNDYDCWGLNRNDPPRYLTGINKEQCTQNRILWAAYYVRDAAWDAD